ncbi:hypothetical protein NDU88_007083 [Pleurodeles waltl]|uniref:Uncharacterized protein n=1 Tax=Pleurodeles waltl TaxID=8319 RepID=A0AAV7RRY7_PLEWA|nr:hypothetical protein NDU88_007083 [Pleurodeles waltl]
MDVPCPVTEPAHSEGYILALKDIMTAIHSVFVSLETKTDTVSTEVALMRADFRILGARVKEAEGPLKTIKDDSATLKEQVRALKATTEILKAKIEDFEGRSHRNNVQIISVPEKSEGPNVDLFVEDLILKQLCGLSQ